jgi:hypothetical protein
MVSRCDLRGRIRGVRLPPLPRLDDASSDALSYPPFAPAMAPKIRIATLGGPFERAEYLSSPGMEGWIPIPRSYLGATWRLEYTFPTEFPTRFSGRPTTSSVT